MPKSFTYNILYKYLENTKNSFHKHGMIFIKILRHIFNKLEIIMSRYYK